MQGTDAVRIAVVQPRSYLRGLLNWVPEFFDAASPPEAYNLEQAVRHAEEAAQAGAQLIAFPETYPGPSGRSSTWPYARTVEVMQACARRLGVYLLFGGAAQQGESIRNTYTLAAPGDEPPVSYAKVVPACGEPSAPGEGLVVVRTPLLTIGMLICWEAWYPELARALALQGVDIIFFPTGGIIYDLRETWRAILQARAAENTIYVASCVNIFGVEPGMAYIFSPEREEAALLEPGIAHATVDLARLRYLRGTDEQLIVPKKYRVVPGLLRSLRPAVVDIYTEAAERALARGDAGRYAAERDGTGHPAPIARDSHP